MGGCGHSGKQDRCVQMQPRSGMGRCVELRVGGDRRGAGTRKAPPAWPAPGPRRRRRERERERFMQGWGRQRGCDGRDGCGLARVALSVVTHGGRESVVLHTRLPASARGGGSKKGSATAAAGAAAGKVGCSVGMCLLGWGGIKVPGCRPGNQAEWMISLAVRKDPGARERAQGAGWDASGGERHAA